MGINPHYWLNLNLIDFNPIHDYILINRSYNLDQSL